MSDMQKLNFFNVDESTLKGETLKRLVALRKSQKATAELRAAFEESFIADTRKDEMIEASESLAFGYKWGKLSVAKIEAGDKKAKASTKPKFSFGK